VPEDHPELCDRISGGADGPLAAAELIGPAEPDLPDDVQDWSGWQEIIDWLRMDGDDGDDAGEPPVGVGEYLGAGPD
jgi:hypothetical protein